MICVCEVMGFEVIDWGAHVMMLFRSMKINEDKEKSKSCN